MNQVWNTDGVVVSGITSSRFDGMLLIVSGTGWFNTPNNTIRHFEWSAVVTDKGWLVTIIGILGRLGEAQGNTFNLPLEIAAVAKRLL